MSGIENLLKAYISSGGPPSEGLLIHWGRRSEDRSLSLRCLTLVLTYTKASESWDVLKEAALEDLEETPSEALSVLGQAVKLAGWPKVEFKNLPREGGEAILATLELDRHYEALVSYPAQVSSKYAQHLAAYELLKGITLKRPSSSYNLQNPEKGNKEVASDPSKNPISELYEYCQRTNLEPPTFEYALQPERSLRGRVSCKSLFQGQTFEILSKSKHDAKVETCSQILNWLRIRSL